MTIPNYDHEIEKRGHPENFEPKPGEIVFPELLTPAKAIQPILNSRAKKIIYIKEKLGIEPCICGAYHLSEIYRALTKK